MVRPIACAAVAAVAADIAADVKPTGFAAQRHCERLRMQQTRLSTCLVTACSNLVSAGPQPLVADGTTVQHLQTGAGQHAAPQGLHVRLLQRPQPQEVAPLLALVSDVCKRW